MADRKAYMRALGLLLLVASQAAAMDVVPYGETHPERQMLYFPAKGPLVVYFHGGAWLAGRKESFAPLGRALASLGLSSAIVDYRLSSTSGVRHPAHAKDGAAALLKLAEKKLPMVIVGHSAGAHLAATLALDRTLGVRHLVRGVVTTEGIFDVPKLARDFPAYVDWFLRPAFGDRREGWKAASPRFLPMAGSPPWWLLHSEADTLVDVAQSAEMHAALVAANVDATLERLTGLEHDEVTEHLGSAKDPLALRLAEFVRRVTR